MSGGVPRGCARNAHHSLSGWEHGLDSHRREQGEDLRPESLPQLHPRLPEI